MRIPCYDVFGNQWRYVEAWCFRIYKVIYSPWPSFKIECVHDHDRNYGGRLLSLVGRAQEQLARRSGTLTLIRSNREGISY
jgi:hypothetical protein